MLLITKEQCDLFIQHNVSLTYTEARTIRDHWLVEAEQLRLAIRMNDKMLTHHVANNEEKNWLCLGYCDYVEHCPEGKEAVELIIKKRAEAKAEREKAKAKAKAEKTDAKAKPAEEEIIEVEEYGSPVNSDNTH